MSSQSLKYVNKLANQRVLVIGGTSGIGFCVAEAAIEHGAQAIISSSNPSKLDATSSRLHRNYPQLTSEHPVITHECDLANPTTMEQNIVKMLQAVTDGGKQKLNHIVFTAGDSLSLPKISELTVDLIQKGGTVRFFAPLLIAKVLPQYMELSAENSFTLTGGSNSQKPSPGWAVMSAWAGAVEGMVRGLAVDLKPLRVNLVSPGAVHTELFSGLGKENLEGLLQHFRNTSTTNTVGTPQDVAEAYIYIMKDQFTTGGMVESNGGRLLV